MFNFDYGVQLPLKFFKRDERSHLQNVVSNDATWHILQDESQINESWHVLSSEIDRLQIYTVFKDKDGALKFVKICIVHLFVVYPLRNLLYLTEMIYVSTVSNFHINCCRGEFKLTTSVGLFHGATWPCFTCKRIKLKPIEF